MLPEIKTVAIETTGRTGSIALLNGDAIIASHVLDPKRRSAQTLAHALRAVLKDHDWTPSQIDLVAVTQGPGSFTGLRVGVTTAKTYAYAAQAQLIGINTLEVIAAGMADAVEPIWCVMDAERNQLFAAKFSGAEESRATIVPTEIMNVDDWLKQLERDDRVAGPVLEKLRDRLPSFVAAAEPQYWLPKAEWVGHLGVRRFRLGQQDDIWQFVPSYFRKSAAEEKLDARGRPSGTP